MNRSVIVALGVVAIVVLVVVILATGGAGPTGNGEAADDVTLSDGAGGPQDLTPADIEEATVTRDGGAFLFVARMGTDIPRRLRDGSLAFRWDLSENGTDTWIVSASVDVSVAAAVTAQRTTYGSSTIDGTMPGSVKIAGDTVTVRVNAARIKRFPTMFQWRLTTTLDADRADPTSATARDTAPDSGVGQVED